MSSPTKQTALDKLYNWAFPPAPTEEEKDASLFGPLAILEIALRTLHPKEANIKYVIEKYRLHPQNIEDYKVLGKSTRWFFRSKNERSNLSILDNKVRQFIEWYFLDNEDPKTKERIRTLLEYTKEGFNLITVLPEYKIDGNTSVTISKYIDTIEFALKGNYPYEKSKITELGFKARALLSPEEIKVIMNIFERAQSGKLDKTDAIDQVEKIMDGIQDTYVFLRMSAVVETNPQKKRSSQNEGMIDPSPTRSLTTSSDSRDPPSRVPRVDSPDDLRVSASAFRPITPKKEGVKDNE